MEPEEQIHQPTPEYETYRTGASDSRMRQIPAFRRPTLPRSAPILGTLFFGIVIGMLLIAFIVSSSIPAIVTLRQNLGLNSTATYRTGTAIQQNLKVEESSAIITAAQKVSPAVVSVTVNQQVQSFYSTGSSTQEEAAGSGFIISSDGLILTNKHVVASNSPGTTYQVVLSTGKVYDAIVQAIDPLNDLAVLKIKATGLPTVVLGNSDDLQVGQSVLAIGNALGEFQNSVSSGIISAKERSIAPQSDNGQTAEQLSGLLQTDAAINPGNSGGPLVNLDGQVIGIDTAIASSSGASAGIGFAIPVNDFTSVISSVIKTGKISVPYLGVRYETVDPTLQQLDSLPVDYGALVFGDLSQGEAPVVPGSPAAAAGLQQNDIILEVNGQKLGTSNTLQRVLQEHQAGENITLKVMRAGKTISIKATLGSQGS